MMKVSDYNFDLPESLIAQTPLLEREQSRLLVFKQNSGEVEHTKFCKILNYLETGDCLVFNDTKVIPARLYGNKADTGAVVEILLLHQVERDNWEVLVKPAKRIKVETEIIFGNSRLKATCTKVKNDGIRILNFSYDGIFMEILEQLGEMPLPPYIKEKLKDNNRYQTVYAREEGSVAAPTAGLHFTPDILQKLKQKGIHLLFLTLHVGPGTFRPVTVDEINDHEMHEEYYSLSVETAKLIEDVKSKGNKVYAVGTTTTRALETIARDNSGIIRGTSGMTNIFIFPGFNFQVVDGLITNFHLPQSTLLMLVSALIGKNRCLEIYKIAVSEKYRFFSFGDVMLIK